MTDNTEDSTKEVFEFVGKIRTLHLQLYDLEAAAKLTSSDVYVRSGQSAAELRDAIRALLEFLGIDPDLTVTSVEQATNLVRTYLTVQEMKKRMPTTASEK